jgi:hypothetical protein
MATNIVNVSDEILANDAFERVKPELAKLAPEDLLQVNLDVSAAVQTILGVLHRHARARDDSGRNGGRTAAHAVFARAAELALGF